MGKPACLPDFSQLANSIAKGTGCTRASMEPPDVFLGRLNRREAQVHKRAARSLETNCCGQSPAPTDLHRHLLRLFPEPATVRVVTTNFDLLFEEAAREIWPSPVDHFSAPALPLGHRFSGIIHVHGDLTNPRDMVLTDADFGRRT